ncbi:hypothetical protein LVY72_08030 [Arthrobacter sp. I2-34]|uniref:DUF7793 domain-containing protein n=1 Tax=Arthrobacter hankyongi TaxID=2904801 RepID=A0ABS9L5B2_9MICC|nr:hypothetical protein [Arthrobacter hankyongi]MCG2621865.1 hypothetical protein [Arthrobacter hankyongi]
MHRSLPRAGAAADLLGVAIRRTAGGTVHVRYSANVHVGATEARQILSLVEELAAGRLRPMLVELAGLGSVSAAAMALFSKRLPVCRLALVGMSPVDMAVATFFNKVHRPPYPVAYFSSCPDAVAWLAQQSLEAETEDSPQPELPHATAGGSAAAARAPGPASTSGQAAGPQQTTGPARLWKKLARLFVPGSAADTTGGRHGGSGPDTLGPKIPARPVPAETRQQVTDGYHGKTGSKSFPKAIAIAVALDYEHVGAFTGMLGQCPPAERDLIVTHLYRHFLHSPRQLALWVKTAGHNYFHARAQVASTGIHRARARPGKISTARMTDRDSAGFNVRQEARDAIALINGLVRSQWPGHIGLEAQHNIISLAASLARLLITAGDHHPLAGSYREYTDLYNVRHSIVENGTGLIDLVLKHPETTGLLCKYIESGRYDGPDGLRRAVLRNALALRQLPNTVRTH